MTYRSIFSAEGGTDAWNRDASVRTCAAAEIEAQASGGQWLFSPEATPEADHSLVTDLGPSARQQMRAWRLCDFLTRTVQVELCIVNRALLEIMAMPGLPRSLHLDAAKIYTDEAYHVVMMLDLHSRLKTLTNLDLGTRSSPGMSSIKATFEKVPPAKRPLATLCAAIVTETLIAPWIRNLTSHGLTAQVARHFHEHSRDEAKHHAFFTGFAERYLKTLDASARGLVEHIVPDIMIHFLRPEFGAVALDLIALGLEEAQARNVITSSIDAARLRSSILDTTYWTRRLFDRAELNVDATFREHLESDDFLSFSIPDQTVHRNVELGAPCEAWHSEFVDSSRYESPRRPNDR